MTRPKSWETILADRYNRNVKTSRIVWDGDTKVETVDVPVVYQGVLIAIDNQSAQTLTATFAQHIRTDPQQATAVITCEDGEDPETITITNTESGQSLAIPKNVYIVHPDEADSPLSVVAEEDEAGQIVIVISLATDELGALDDTENTAEAIVALINGDAEGEGEVEGIGVATAVYSGDGSGVVSLGGEEELSVEFTGGYVERWASLYDSDGDVLSLSVATTVRRVFGPFSHFPRFLGGRITLTAGTAPTEAGVTTVQVQAV